MTSLKKRVNRALQQARGHSRPFTQTDPLLVGVSGGPDSMALLHLLNSLYSSAALTVAHLNHQLRPGAAAEAQLVAGTASSRGMACFVDEVDVAMLAKDEGLSLEEAGRLARYRFFAKTAVEIGASNVAVAHNADDQVETILMHLLRGSGLAGLRGMAPVSPMPGAPEINLLRPLLGVGRTEIERYCHQQGLQPVEDDSNLDTTFYRNRLRHELIPFLEQFNPQIRRRLQHTASLVAADYEALEQQLRHAWERILREEGDGWLSLDREAWLEMPLSIRRSSLRRAVGLLRPDLRDVSFRPIEHARLLVEQGQSGKQASLPGELALHVRYDRIVIDGQLASLPSNSPQLADGQSLFLPIPGRASLTGGWIIEAGVLNQPDFSLIKRNQDPWVAFIDVADTVLQLRPRRPGERFQPLGLGGKSARLKEVMINRKIPVQMRRNWPVVANDDHLVWLTGHQLDERAQVTSQSQRVVKLHCRPRSDTASV